jgi:hypothetical protein
LSINHPRPNKWKDKVLVTRYRYPESFRKYCIRACSTQPILLGPPHFLHQGFAWYSAVIGLKFASYGVDKEQDVPRELGKSFQCHKG